MWRLLNAANGNTVRFIDEYATPAIGWYWRGVGGLLMVAVIGSICWAFVYWFYVNNNPRY